jgi:hypothetical protein
LARVPDAKRLGIARNFLSARQAITHGVVAKTTNDRQKYWRHWCSYASMFGINPFLIDTNPIDINNIVTGFAANVRTGVYGRGNKVRVSTVTDAISAINQTIQLAGEQTPLYRAPQVYTLPLERLIEGYRRDDPPSTPQLAVPLSVANACFEAATTASDPKTKATGHLILIAFYYLLRVGEYTKPRFVNRNNVRVSASRTKQFQYSNIGFFKNNEIVPRTSPLSLLLSCDSATMKISNQKNGRMGETIHQNATGTALCPVKALAYRIHHITENGGTCDRLICDYFDNGEWNSVRSNEIIAMVRLAAKLLNLHKQGIDPDLIGAHSLRAGGAMALKLHGFDNITIMKMGRWTSLTFTQYIHNQIAHLAKDISKKMSIPLPFLNIASIEGNQPANT